MEFTFEFFILLQDHIQKTNSKDITNFTINNQ